MAFTLDTSLQIPTGTGFTTGTVSGNYTCGAGSTLLVLGVVDASGLARSNTTPTYGGINLSKINSTQKAASSPEVAVELWYILNPSTGSAYSLSLVGDASLGKQLKAASFKSDNGTPLLNASVGSNGTSANPSLTVSASTNGLVISVLGDGGASIPTAFSGGRAAALKTSDHGAYTSVMSYFMTSSNADASIWYTIGSDDWGSIAASFSEAPYVPFTWGGILKEYIGSSWYECPSSRLSFYNGASWTVCPSTKFKLYRNSSWMPIRFQGAGTASSLLTGLLGYWNLNETSGTTMADSLGVNALTLDGTATVNATGILGKAVDFNNNTTYLGGLALPNNFTAGKFTSNTVSISMWVNLTATPTQPFYFFDLHNTNESGRIYANYVPADGPVIYFACMPATPNWDEYTYTSSLPAVGQWQHLVFVCKGIGTDSILIYLNGTEVHNRQFDMITAIDTDLGGNFDVFGNTEYTNGDAMYGKMDEVGIWNRALTATEVTTLYNAGAGKTHPFN
jgi:hypothetical protein